ncbi:MAG: EAL domain-containing protein [Woeseiaceae bacterium]|nr:EAL domain-containing protein [Woeseiaceae bacterium]
MKQDNPLIRIDPGSMSVFATQILEAVRGARAVVVHDTAGQVAWASPGLAERNTSDFDSTPDQNKYVFDLKHASSHSRIGTLGILTTASDPDSAEFVHSVIEPILQCIERQVDINTELSAVRHVSEETRRGAKLLIELDDLDDCADPVAAIQQLLERSASHFGALFTAVLLPGDGIQAIYPTPAADNPENDRRLMGRLGKLMSSAKMHRKVTRSRSGRSHFITTPVFDSADDVIGVYVVASESEFSNDQIRLCRAISSKLYALGNVPETTVSTSFSRNDFLRYVAEVIRRESATSHAVLMVDIDKLHIVNDNFGHMAGDKVIKKTNRQLVDCVKRGDIVARLGGDIFGMFLRGADEQDAVQRAEFLLQTVATETVRHENRNVSVTASIGVALIPDVVSDAESAVSTAEVATRSAKGRGGNRCVVFRDLDASVMQRRSDLDQVGRLQSALLDDRFVLFAQPIKPLQTAETAPRYEILVRMLEEDGTVLPPNKFLSAAERYQMMSAIDRWVIRQTLDQLSAADNPLEVGLGSFSINVSAQSLMDKDFLEFVEHQIAESGVPPDAICFEITETSIVRCLEMAQYFISRMRHLGCRVALDDFGTGYCSFAYLKDLSVNYVKVDGVFIRDILENPLSEAIVASLVRIAEVMSAAVVAEHVETDLIVQRLRQHGVSFGQGFGIGKPRPLQDVLAGIGPTVDFASHTSKVRVGE